ncbi:MAG: C25 family cysteine peptidase [Crocinitomicaceae bacterium]|nr:C25 family cysteine peptidase [Crocinitomicaceae bacterium]
MTNWKPTILLLLLSIFTWSAPYAQTFGNEWIDYSQSYYQIKIVEDGVYSIDSAALANAGVPIGSISSENFQLFGREKEIPLHIEDGGDSSIDGGDYILFFAQRNDGWLDSTLYLDPNTLASPGMSLYNDTIQYFLTWNGAFDNLRYTVETDVDFASYTPATHFMSMQKLNYFGEYYEGRKSSDITSSFFVPGEGWGNPKYNGAGGGWSNTVSLPTPLSYSGVGAPNAEFLALCTSASNAITAGSPYNHHLRLRLGNSGATIRDTSFYGYEQIKTVASIAATEMGPSSTPFYFEIIDDLGVAADRQAYTYLQMKYPRLTNFGNQPELQFSLRNSQTEAKTRLDITAAGYSDPIVFVHGETPRMIPFLPNGGTHSMLIPNSSSGIEQSVVYSNFSEVATVSLTPVNGSGTFTDFSTIPGIQDSVLLMVFHESLGTAVDNYKSYRESLSGGGYNVVKANVEELFQQFGGGIEKHISGIRRFADFIDNNATQKPSGLFLIGKGIREAVLNSFTSDGPGTRFDPSRFQQSLVPSFGHPSSDVAITAGLDGVSQWAPLLPTGRISVRSESELQGYLDKVIEYELQQDANDIYDTPNKDWQKHVIHFAGGTDAQEQGDFQAKMNILSNIISDSLFGGSVTKVYKTDSNPLDPTVLSSVTDRLEAGVSLMSYLGHASPTASGFEVNLDEPINWNNSGKYPVMLVNSCYNGNIFQLSNSKSEEFVQQAGYGAIAYIASVHLGLATDLSIYSSELYRNFSSKDYGGTLGGQMQRTISLMEASVGTFNMEATCEQMTLNGDPMLRLNWHTEPEIELLPERVSFGPAEIDLLTDSIEMNIVLRNLGKSVTTPFSLEVRRSFPQSTIDSVYFFQIPELHYTDTFSFKMPLQSSIALGLNTFTIAADIPSIVGEVYDEINNNQIVKTLFIDIDGILPILPYDFAVVPNDSVTVKASTVNPIADYNTYRFEIDTTDLFNSPEHRYAMVSGFGGVKEVHPSQWLGASSGMSSPLVCEDSVVYFWRVSIDDPSPDWREFSFQHINGREGWGQDHFFQFKKNGFAGINYDRPSRTREFAPNIKSLSCRALTGISLENQWNFDGEGLDLFNYGMGTGVNPNNFYLTPKFCVAIIDPNTLVPWYTRYTGPSVQTGGPYEYIGQNLNNDFGNNNNDLDGWYEATSNPRPMNIFTFAQDDTVRLNSFQDLILNQVPDSHYILIYTPRIAEYDTWAALDSADMYGLFQGLGSDSIHAGRTNLPFIFFCKKGDPNSVVEEFCQDPSGDVSVNIELVGKFYNGFETSTKIGPAADWGNVYWKQDPLETPTLDSTNLRITAYDWAGAPLLTIDTLFTSNDSIIDLSTVVDASLYPFLTLNASYVDTLTFTPAQVDRWHVLYQPLPEAAIDGTSLYTFTHSSDTLEAGQDFDFAVDVKNIFSVDMDSLLVEYWVEDANQIKHPIAYDRQGPLLVGETLRDTITVSTEGLNGINLLIMEVNPYVNGSLYITDQPEQEHFNNLLQLPFYVNPDDVHPILDVTFNGRHILNGDIVDPNSEVLITLKDDNEFLIMDDVSDTTNFGIYLTDPNGIQTRIPFVDGNGNMVMQWIPAEPQHKRFKIIWPSELTIDGMYTLFVQGTDKSGNLSGDLDYKVSFEVIHESSITNMMNYPNPFSTSTRFVFTLTGSEEPDEILIQILTVSGRVVREITEDQLGQIHIGRNITEYAWDGTDEFGDPLANGVYLYRVKTELNGESIEHRKSGADTHFTKGFGKMYLMR